MNYRAAKVRGFTLLEMLVATAMVAMLAGSLYASLHIAFKARQSALASVEGVRKASLSIDLIQADLQSAMIPNGVLAGAFVGSSSGGLLQGAAGDTLAFYAAAMDIEPGADVGVGDIKKIEYSCEAASDAQDLVLVRRITTNLLAPTTLEPKEEVLCRGVRAFTVKYYDGSAWQDNWDSTVQNNVLPKAVEVTIEFKGAAGDADCQTSRVLLIPCGQNSDVSTSSGGTP